MQAAVIPVHARRAAAVIFFAALAVAATGCTVLQQSRSDNNGPPPVMMNADSVPLAGADQTRVVGQPVPVPLEPSPFIAGKGGQPSAMQSDNQPRPPRRKAEAGPQPIPREPIPSAEPDS